MQGIKTFIATNYNLTEGNRTAAAAHNETYAHYPDDSPLHSLALKGDSRAALVPFLAHEYAHNITHTLCVTRNAKICLSAWPISSLLP